MGISRRNIILILAFIFIVVGTWIMIDPKKKLDNFAYDVLVGSAGGYSALLDFNHNYFVDKNGKILLAFTSYGGVANKSWGWGEQATGGLEGAMALPYAIKVRWFSIPENQFWQGEAVLNQEKLEQLKQYKVNNILYPGTGLFLANVSFVVNYGTGGLVTIWVSNDGEQFLLTQFQAKKIEEPNWDSFIQPVLGKKISRKDYLASKMNLKNGGSALNANIRQEVLDHKVPGAEPWLRLMKTYSWVLKTNDLYELKDYETTYVNGEQYYTYQNQDQTKPRAIPKSLVTLMEDRKTHQIIRLDYDINQDEIINAFEKLAKEQGSEPIQIYLDIDEKLTNANLYLIKGSQKIEIKQVVVDREDPPSNYK